MPLSSAKVVTPVELSSATTSCETKEAFCCSEEPSAKWRGVRPLRSILVFDSGYASERLLITSGLELHALWCGERKAHDTLDEG